MELHAGIIRQRPLKCGSYSCRVPKGLLAHRIGRLWNFKLSQIYDWVEMGGTGDGVPRKRIWNCAVTERTGLSKNEVFLLNGPLELLGCGIRSQ